MTSKHVITADRVWDGKQEHPLEHHAIIIQDSKIKNLVPVSYLDPVDRSQLVEIKGATLMPGLIDSHSHLSMDPSMEDYLDHMNDDVQTLTKRAVSMMKKDLYAGITTCRCLGDKEYLDIYCRQEVQEEKWSGPRLLVAGKGIRASSGHGFVGYPFDGIQKITEAIEENVSHKVDLIKFYITGTLKGAGDIPSFLSKDEIESLIAKAHTFGLKTAAHCVGGVGLDWAVDAGLDTLEHAYHIGEDQIKKLLRSKTWPVLTPSPILLDERVNHLPKNLIAGHVNEKEPIKDRMSALINSGISYAVGSDGMHGALAGEVEFLVEMGAKNVEALRAATLHGAIVCGIDNQTGSLEKGKEADIIAVQGDPFKRISDLWNIMGVMKMGKWIVNYESQ